MTYGNLTQVRHTVEQYKHVDPLGALTYFARKSGVGQMDHHVGLFGHLHPMRFTNTNGYGHQPSVAVDSHEIPTIQDEFRIVGALIPGTPRIARTQLYRDEKTGSEAMCVELDGRVVRSLGVAQAWVYVESHVKEDGQQERRVAFHYGGHVQKPDIELEARLREWFPFDAVFRT